MEWTEIIITVSANDVDLAGDIAQMVVPYGIYIEDYTQLEQQVEEIAHIDLIDEDLLKKDRSKALIHVYISPEENPAEAIAFLSERYTSEGISHKISTQGCEEQDWMNNWKQYFNPIPVGEKLLIRPTWREKYDAGDRLVLNIDPGVAFGTGSHETTRLCLETIERYIKPGGSLLDVGCGSGILSIAGVLLGAEHAVGVDIDQIAVKTAKENTALNQVSDKIQIIHGSFTEKIDGKFDIIVANIVADAIISLSGNIVEFMKDDSVYIMSGIIDTRLNEVLEAVGKNFSITEVIEDNGWACIAAGRKA